MKGFEASSLLEKAGFLHGFSLRTDGAGPLDFGVSPDLSPIERGHRLREVGDAVARLGAAIGFEPRGLYHVHQVHGARVREAVGDPDALAGEEADALVLRGTPDGRRCAVGVRTADCVPVLLASRRTGSVAAVHAGWPGVVAGVIGAACDAMLHDESETRGDWIAAIGPCIGPCCFEVGQDVAAQVVEACASPEVVVKATDEKAYVDLRGAVRAQLKLHGLTGDRIDDVAGCTRCEASRFFSFRRERTKSGRHLGVIVARNPQ